MVPTATDRTVSLLARAMVPVMALVAVLMTLRGGQGIVVLLLMGYNFVTQLFPALILCLGRRPLVSARSAFAGILAGVLTVAYVTVTGATVAGLAPSAPQFMKDLNVGIVALIVNVVVLTLVALVTRRPAAVATRAEIGTAAQATS